MPATSIPSFAEICSVLGAAPLAGLTVSQVEESLAAVKLSVPPPVLLTVTGAFAGLVPMPWVALNETAEVDSDNAGGGAATFKGHGNNGRRAGGSARGHRDVTCIGTRNQCP